MKRYITILILGLLATTMAQGQIKIGGNVYGGGNKGNVEGCTRVTVKAGDIGYTDKPDSERPLENPRGRVFGGARMANVGGSTFVHIDGESDLTGDLATKSNYILVNQVFGGNDIAGHIGTAAAVGEEIPTELTAVKDPEVAADATDPKKNDVDNTFNSYVRVSTKLSGVKFTAEEIAAAELDPEKAAYGKTTNDMKPAEGARKVYIGQLFAGGNGYFDYEQTAGPTEGKVTHTIYNKSDKNHSIPLAQLVTDEGEVGFQLPELNKTYLEVVGGSIVYAYGGGNNATVKEKTIIHIDNPSAVVNHIYVDDDGVESTTATEASHVGYTDLLTNERFLEMGINTTFSMPSSGAYQVGRFFGGNNLAEMHIRPTWNLLSGKVRNLYSGGNKGNMTSPEGLLLEIPDYSTLIVDNLYGGCRMADVMPTVNGEYTPCKNLDGYNFPNELSARTLVRGGYIHNVYGGNDVTGTVYGGNAIGIYTTVHGDVYGGGNGAYPYTDSEGLQDDNNYGDFYYGDKIEGSQASYDALNAFRPNAEQVSVRLKGTKDKPTVIKGSVFVGGNCASLATKKPNPMVELKIGSYVWADKVFLGNNGEGMVNKTILQHYAGSYPGVGSFSSLILTDPSVFAGYMDGVTMGLQPSIVFDSKANGDPDDYKDYTSKIGSFYCGGNVGSMAISGKNTYRIDRGLVIFDKFVAGCNNANIKAQDGLNADYEGGILGAENERNNVNGYYTEDGTATGKIKDRIELNLDNVVIEPRRWKDTFVEITSDDIVNGKLKAGQTYYTTDLCSSRFVADGTEDASTSAADKYYKMTAEGQELDWNTALWSVDENDFMATDSTTTANDKKRRLLGGNVYGGCYNSGHVNGNVVININQDLIKRDVVFANPASDDPYTISGARRSGVLREAQGDDVQSVAMTVFGAGCGEETEVWGSTTVNLNNGYAFQVFGGGEEGVVGKKNAQGDYVYNAAYSSTVNLKGANAGYSEKVSGLPLAETEYIYGGGNEGDVIGDAYVYLGNGRVYDAFGGASNADIYGGTEVYIGHNGGFPWIRDNVYGGNDFGGNIKGKRNHTTAITKDAFDATMLQSSTYVKYLQGRVDSIFGGCYGSYDYTDPVFKDYTYSKDEANIPAGKSAGSPRLDNNNEPVFSFPHMDDNSFVHFTPEENGNNKVGFIFGGSEGFPGHVELNNTMQKECYVHVHDAKTKDVNRFANVDIYGGGAFAGTGMLGDSPENTFYGAGRTAVDLWGGSFHNVYGGCNQEGLVGYTRVNVPSGSTVKVNALFGGGKGYSADTITTVPALAARYCDHYVTCIDYQSADAIVNDAIYGGNENSRIACDTYINIAAPVMQSSGYQASIYGAGYGKKTVSGRTNVFMNNNSNAYKVFGGGRDGNSFNFVSLKQWLGNQFATAGTPEGEIEGKVTGYGDILRTFATYLATTTKPVQLPDKTGTYVNASTGEYDGTYTNDILPVNEYTMPTYHQTNVHLMNGSNVSGYAYGGGLGTDAVVAGSTYIELKGGNVDRDIYGGGQGGPVFDEFGLGTNIFTATTNVYVEGGMARNIYGGGYLGHVGKHCKTVDNKIVEAAIHETNENDILAVANVTIGKVDGTSFYDGIPAITRNVYGGGEGGSVYGTANLTINNGYIGYRYKNTATSGAAKYEYVEELDDQKPNAIELAGNAFGGGYVVNSYVDKTNVSMYGGTIRGSLYGGGEIGPIGRGTIRYKDTYKTTGLENGNARIFKAGKTSVKMYDGLVKRNVFGGGRGKDSWGGDGTMYMSDELKPTLDLQCKGYVFGQTEVDIYGGEVGTDEGMAQGYGNVFGGGDEGSVYSALEIDGNLHIGKKTGERYKDDTQGYYFLHDGSDYIMNGTDYTFTEDCKVLVEPWLQVKNSPISYDPDGDGPEPSKAYEVGDYIPTDYLNTLKAKVGDNWPAEWNNVDVGTETTNGFKERGVIIHNAVFAGGNIASGSSSMYANEKTVFGNATASIHDAYNRDFITIGTGHTGGLYGDGNLTFVDGYRELNITNYGSDYYHIARTLSYDDYQKLPKREQDYYEVKYKCIADDGCTDREGTTYKKDATLPKDELLALFTWDDGTSVRNNDDGSLVTEGTGGTAVLEGTIGHMEPNQDIWKENGVVSTYAGRIMNTIQRADLCGVFGSRMVMKGARDRVPETVDYTNYTINRVREVSLNKEDTPAGDTDADNTMHGNYFGIYSIVNYLGSLTSDVDFQSVRTTKASGDLAANGTTTFEQWKEAHKNDRKRNNGNCHNQMALASGVYLELTTEQSTGTSVREKDWGLITGVVELDLINVQAGVGGGFVYAKNEHGYRTPTNRKTTTLTKLNEDAVTKWDFNYDSTDEAWSSGTTGKKEWQTSGNFIHSSQTIIDDCYNESNRYLGEGKVPAHYWFISGQVYVYDQTISAYTGSPNAFSETVEIPITINAASNGTMTLVDVQPNYHAFYSSYTNSSVNSKLGGDKKLVINDVTYQLNDPISYWDWNKLPQSEKSLFVKETYILKDSCYINNQYYPAGYVMLPSEYNSLKTHAVDQEIGGQTVKAVKKATKNADGDEVVEKDRNNHDVYVAFTEAFRSSNNMSHSKGYILTYHMTNPTVWDKWYTQVTDNVVENQNVLVKNQIGGEGFEDGPTYYPTENGLYGQQKYAVNDIIPQKTYTDYNSALTNLSQSPAGQATFIDAHLVTTECTQGSNHYYPGAAVSAEISGHTAPAYVCTSTIKLSESEFIYINELMTEAQKTAYYNRFNKEGATDAEKLIATDINKLIVPAYICTGAGLYGGNYYLSNKNYRALEAWSSMSESDRQKFAFNYDALDLLVDSTYSGTKAMKYQYDSADGNLDGAKANAATYSLKTPIDYKATYNGTTDTESHNGITRTNGVEYTRAQYESLPNEQRHYAPILVTAAGTIYVVNTDFVHVETPYAVGSTISSEEYGRLTSSEQTNITQLKFTSNDFSGTGTTYYYCREEYKIGEKGEGVKPTSVSIDGATGGIVTRENEEWVTVGTLIPEDNSGENVVGYSSLKNYQKNFTIHGVSPTETSTLYVGRNADINDLSTEKIITVIYKYDYEESDADGMHITPVSERHVVNIHIKFKSGVPVVEDIQEPDIVLPGSSLTMRVPTVKEGAYDILGGGWELFDTPTNAESHTNGIDYKMLNDSLYWYQDGYYLAYYAKTYLGKTYSNHVPVRVANYHDLKKVMDDKKYHLHVDYDRSLLKRDSKIYINDYSSSSQNGLDLLKDLYDLSLRTTVAESGSLKDHALLNNSIETGTNIFDGQTYTKGVKAGQNLQFILRTDISKTDNPAVSNEWTSIASNDDPCFQGTLHGDGHTISGLDNSLFGKLCGSVYNLGVMGSFTGAGVADEGDGYVESCWINTTGTPDGSVYAVFGNPTDEVSTTKQIVNSYYQSSKTYKTDASNHGVARPISDRAFYNGEVAYDLNNFYLYKRYNDGANGANGANVEYKYWKAGEEEPQTGKYAQHEDLCSSGYNNLKYVENRYTDGDFRYAAGTITTTTDERQYIDTQDNNKEKFFPIWPDDYLFFGQKLTYGYAVEAHQNVPTAIVKSNGRLSQYNDANRVYRAPAYFRSSDMKFIHFNPQAYLAQKSKDGTKDAYPGLTAIDFAGHNDTKWDKGSVSDGFPEGSPAFYPPLLDDGGLLSITNCDETQNLLVYAPAETATTGYANKATYDVLTNYFVDPAYSSYYSDNDYRTVADATSATSSIYGHLVMSDLKATCDHLLVDKQDFNAPIAYTFDKDHRMWYQRIPEDQEYVDRTKGWQGISIPFTAELVTTNDKGEITHFYSGSATSANSDKKIGHEYWLREFNAINKVPESDPEQAKATFNYPIAAGDNKTVKNTFLWDYYYEKSDRKDKNSDIYQNYYSGDRTYAGYPLLAGGKPYILGLPGSTYYEFDLSGNFEAKNTYATIDKLGKQAITFASNTGIEIGVSDTEMTGVTKSKDGTGKNYSFTFKPSYMNMSLEAGNNYTLDTAGDSYDKVTATTKVSAFRPYFTATTTAAARYIVFDRINDEFGDDYESDKSGDGALTISTRPRHIIVKSTLKDPRLVTITNAAGVRITTFTIQPGQTIETLINMPGFYIVNKTKVAVR